MRTSSMLSVYITFLGFTTVNAGDSVFFPQCLDWFKKHESSLFSLCIQGNLTDKITKTELCKNGDYLSIEDFVLHKVRNPSGNCDELSGFNYIQTVNASCLQKVDSEMTKKIALVLFKAYNGNQYEHVIESQVQSSLNEIVTDLSLIGFKFSCSPNRKDADIDLCNNTIVEGLNKRFIKLDTTSFNELESRPSTCTCSVKSSRKNITVKAVDVRLSTSDELLSYQDYSLSGSNIFQDSLLLWRLDGQKLISSNFVNITLTMKEKLKFPESLWLEIEGSNMTISCRPEYDIIDVTTERNVTMASKPTKVAECLVTNVVIVVLVVVAVVATAFITTTLVACYKYYNLLKSRAINTDYDQLDVNMSDLTKYQNIQINVAPTTPSNSGVRRSSPHEYLDVVHSQYDTVETKTEETRPYDEISNVCNR